MLEDDGVERDHSRLWHALQELAQGAGVQREDLLEALQGELIEIQRCWGVNIRNGLRTAQVIIMVNLREHVRQIAPRPSRQEISADVRRDQYRQAVLVSFNALDAPQFEEVKKNDLMDRRRWLSANAGGLPVMSISTSQRDLSHAIGQIEQQILAGYEPIAVSANTETPAPSQPSPALFSASGVGGSSTRIAPDKSGRRAQRVVGQVGEPTGVQLLRSLVYCVLIMTLLLTSLPLAARLLPPFVLPHFLQLVDDNLASTAILVVLLSLGIVIGFVLWLLGYAESRKLSAARGLTWLLVSVLAFANVVVRPVVYVSSTQLAASISSQLSSWQPVILDNGTFDNSTQSCQEPTTGRYGLAPTVFKLAGGPDLPDHVGSDPGEQPASVGKIYVPAGRSVSADSYQCAVREGALRTRLSLATDDLLVMYSGDGGKSVGHQTYYIETEVRPIDGSHLSSCVLATAKFSDSAGPTTVFSVVNAIDNGAATYRAKVFQAGVESGPASVTTARDVVQTEYLPFVVHDTPFDNFDGWVKLAVYKSSGTVDLLVDDRVVATFADPDVATVYPQLGTRAGSATTGGAAACEFKYLRAYSSG